MAIVSCWSRRSELILCPRSQVRNGRSVFLLRARAALSYRGLPLDHLEDLVVRSPRWKKVEGLLLPKEEMAGGRPITPLHGGHVGLLCTVSLLNGVFGQGNERHRAR